MTWPNKNGWLQILQQKKFLWMIVLFEKSKLEFDSVEEIVYKKKYKKQWIINFSHQIKKAKMKLLIFLIGTCLILTTIGLKCEKHEIVVECSGCEADCNNLQVSFSGQKMISARAEQAVLFSWCKINQAFSENLSINLQWNPSLSMSNKFCQRFNNKEMYSN